MKTIKISTIAKAVGVAAVAAGLSLGLADPAGAAAGTMYGDPAAAAQWWRHQHYGDCAIMAAADVVGQMTGKEPSEPAIIKVAQSTPSTAHAGSIYIQPVDAKHDMGTNPADLPTLLARYGIKAVITDKNKAARTGVPTGIEALEHQLAAGHKVIAGVNAEMIWHQEVESKDENGDPVADHAVVVTGIDTANGIVHLNDSGIKTGRDEQVPLELFLRAWDTGDDLMVVTT